MEYITYNVHNLLHLCDDVLLYGQLDNFSAFKFQSYMSKIKSMKNSRYPLQQIYNRVIEDRKLPYVEKISNFPCFQEDISLVSNENGKIYTYYRKLTYENFTISLCQRNNCVLLKNSSYMLISNIYKNNNNIKIVGKILQNVSNFVTKPSFSLAIKVIDIHEISEISTYDIKDIQAKCVILPFNNKFVVIPILHKNY